MIARNQREAMRQVIVRGAAYRLTWVQTRQVPRLSIVLFGGEFWRPAVNLGFLVEEAMIGAGDAASICGRREGADAVAVLHDFYHGTPP